MNYKVEGVTPYNKEDDKQEQVIQLFDTLAPSYDRLNGLLALGIDNYWRRDSMKELRKYSPKTILDIATGTGDFALLANEILQPEKIIAADISEGMMKVGAEKVLQRGLQDIISFEVQDSAQINHADETFDAVTISFGVRNFKNIDQSFQEIHRVLKPGGVFLFIELTTPEKKPIKKMYDAYSKYVMPIMSRIMEADQQAQDYLSESIEAFPQGREMMLILQKNGFVNIRLRRFTLGAATVYIAERASNT